MVKTIRLPFGWRYRRHIWATNKSTRLANEPIRYVPHFYREQMTAVKKK